MELVDQFIESYPGEDITAPVFETSKTYLLNIRGLSPLLQHNPTTSMVKSTRKKSVPEPEVEAKRGLYPTDEGTFYHPADAIRHALIIAGLQFKAGRSSFSPKVQNGLFPLQTRVMLLDPDTLHPLEEGDYQIDVRRAVIQGNGVLRARPRWDKWATRLFVEVDPLLLETQNLVDIADYAGRTEGIGDFRPSSKAGKGRGGPFGRFAVEVLEV